MLQVKNLSTWFKLEKKWLQVLDNVSFNIDQGEIVSLLGHSGSGKSITALSILRLLSNNAYYAKDSQILFNQCDLLLAPEHKLRKIRGGEIAMIFQDPMLSLNPVFTVQEQIAEVFYKNNNISKAYVKEQVLQLLRDVQISDPVTRLSNYPHELSGGMKQRVMLAIALAGKPKLLIADEPTTALDVTIQAQILSLLHELKLQHKISILFITHDLAVAANIADRILVMQDGKLIEQHTTNEFFTGVNVEKETECKDTQNVSTHSVLQVEDVKIYFPIRKGLLRKTVNYVKAVDGVNFTLQQGKTLAIVGESGCGKTTLGKSIVNLIPLSGGKIDLLNGIKLSDVQIIFQDPFSSMDPKMRIIDILLEGMLVKNKKASYATLVNKVDELLIQVGLEKDHKLRYPHEFSGGQRQRICIARALAVEPKILVCDEPTSALDVVVQKQILALLQKLQKKLGLSYIFISHDLSVVRKISHYVAVMYLGKIVEYGSASDLLGVKASI